MSGRASVIAAFGRRACAAREHRLEPAVRHAATRSVVDWFGAALAGSAMEPARILCASLLGESRGTSRVVADGRMTSCRTAALINGTASHTAEVDDIYRDGIYHPGSPTIAAALALAEREGSSGDHLIRAVVAGYELGNRVAAAINPAHYLFWHTTGTVGTLGAAAAAAEILLLDPVRWTHAIATATTMAAGLQQAFRSDSMSKPLHAGHAAEAGVLAALLAREGFTGAHDILEGPAGFGAAMGGTPVWAAAVDAFRGDSILTTTVKPHACCGHAFAPVDAALELRARGIRPDEVATIVVETYAAAKAVAGNDNPKTAFEAKFSIPYCVAAALVTGSVQLPTFDDSTLARADLRGLASRVAVEVDPELTAAFPGRRGARVLVYDHSGVVHCARRTTRRGDPDDPVSDDEMSAKFKSLAAPVVGAKRAEILLQALWGLSDVTDVNRLPLG